MADKPRVYLETTVSSYLTAWQSAEVVTAAHQQITKRWWQLHRLDFDLFASELVFREAQAGDADAAQRRLEVISELQMLMIEDEATQLGERLVGELALPDRASADAVHIAIAIVNGMDYLVSWNCRHIVNALHRHTIDRVCESLNYVSPVICTPEELMGE